MTRSYEQQQRLHWLIGTLCNETIVDNESAELEGLLLSSVDAQQLYIQYLDMHGMLRRCVAHIKSQNTSIDSWPVAHDEWEKTDGQLHGEFQENHHLDALGVPQVAPLSVRTAHVPGLERSRWLSINRTSAVLWALALAVNIALIFVLALAVSPRLLWHVGWQEAPIAQSDHIQTDTPIYSARLIAAHHCHWSDESQLPRVGDLLSKKALRLKSGIAEIQFLDGTRVTMEGPCDFEPQTTSQGFLRQGKLVALVPEHARGFAIETVLARIIDLGTEFGVEVTETGLTDVHVLKGQVEVNRVTETNIAGDHGIRLAAGQAVRVMIAEQSIATIRYDASRFQRGFEPSEAAGPAIAETGFVGPIWLGNLFDDPKRTPLKQAMETDTFRATAEIDDLGVDRAPYHGDALKKIAPHVQFDFENLGWEPQVWRRFRIPMANDAGSDVWAAGDPAGAIRTQGAVDNETRFKLEEGIGMHANALITFDLEELRVAARWQNRVIQFVSERAGINDDMYGKKEASVYMVALICDRKGVLTAALNGQPVKAIERQGVWSLKNVAIQPLRADGEYASFRVPIPSSAKYLTLAATSAWDGVLCDHAVWSGARIEISNSDQSHK